jgi:hypothetical protein
VRSREGLQRRNSDERRSGTTYRIGSGPLIIGASLGVVNSDLPRGTPMKEL